MAVGLVQLQKGLSMAEFMQRYGTEAKCYHDLYRACWPQGFRCPACGDRSCSCFRRGRQVYYQCRSCQHQTTLLSGTNFASTKLSLRTWMLAIHLLTLPKTNMGGTGLMQYLGVNYKAAWRIKHKVMQVMGEREVPPMLSGFVRIDDAYLGGERSGGMPMRVSENKQVFLIMIQTDGTLKHLIYAVIEPVHSFDDSCIKNWQVRHLAPDFEVFSDGLSCLRCFDDASHAYTVLEIEGQRAAGEVRGARWVNVLLANTKRAISGSYHEIRQSKYVHRYVPTRRRLPFLVSFLPR